MQLTRTIQAYKPTSQGVVATIGNFDGVHLGHQTIIHSVISKSKQFKLPSMVITFEPSAKEYFLKNDAPARLTNFREKFSLIKELGADQFVCLKFNNKLANMTAENFIETILVNRLAIKSLTVGDNFRFGKNRKGDFALLQSNALQYGYEVEDTGSFSINKKRVSSTLIRRYLATGELDLAEQMLGREYSISGKVVHGDKKGRTIGFPTANVPIHRKKCAINGVFAVEINMQDGSRLKGVANIGHRPTVGGTRTQLEVHIFNLSKDIYGEHISVSFRKKLREEKKFTSFEELKKQIELDSQSAQDFFQLAA